MKRKAPDDRQALKGAEIPADASLAGIDDLCKRAESLLNSLSGKEAEAGEMVEILREFTRNIPPILKQREETARLALIPEHTRNRVLLTDTERRITWANRAFLETSGYALDEVLGRNPKFLQGPETDLAAVERMRDALNADEGFREQVLNYSKNGRCYWNDITCVPIRENGRVTGYMAIMNDVTPRMDREFELQNFRTVIEQSPLSVVITDPTGKIEYVNPAFEAVTGYSRAEALGQNPRILKSGLQSEAFYNDLWETISSGRVWSGFLQNKHKDGAIFWESASISPVLDRNGVIIRYIAVKQDITESHQRQEQLDRTIAELSKTKDFLEQTERVSRVGGWAVELGAEKVYHSKITREIYGLQPGEELTVDEAILFFKEGEDRERIRQAVETCFREGTAYDVECRFLPRWGGEIWVRAIGQPQIEDGRIVGIYGTFQDIDEQKQLRERLEGLLREEKKQLQFVKELTQAIPVAIFTKDLEGRYIQANPAFYALHGLKPDEVIGRTSADVFPGTAGLALHETDLTFLQRENSPIQEETHSISNHRPILMTKSVFHDELGKIAGLVGAQTDISEIKRLQENLRQAKLDADASNRSKSAFLATMSHEIRTPLNAVIGMASLLEEISLDAQQREYAHTIVSASETLLALINDILDYSKIESRRLEIHLEEFVFEDCFLEPVEWFSREALEKQIEVVHYLDPSLPKVVYGDKLRLRQILMNLLSNAVKFTSEGQVSIEVRLESSKSPLEPLEGRKRILFEFQIRDNGIGISPEAQKRLFHPFSQADSSITRKYGGSGLGLAITRRLVELMGGSISLDSKPGQGSTFTFTLPLGIGLTPAKPNHPEPFLQGRRLLVVDDVEVNRNLIAAFGTRWGLVVQGACSAPEAWKIVESEEAFDFILLDYQMPGEDGATLARKLREDARFSSIPRLLLSSVPEPSEQFEAGLFQLILHKPLRPAKLKSHLLRLAATTSAARPQEPATQLSRAAQYRVLLAEDNPNNQTVLRLMMKKLGSEFSMVENGEQALREAFSSHYDIILLDVQMPVMDGLTAVQKIREHYDGQADRPYLVSLTANAFAEDRQACLDAGFDFYLPKPITLHQLEDVFVRRPIAGKQSPG